MTRSGRQPKDRPPTGVMARTEHDARSLAHELHLYKPVCFSPTILRRGGVRGIDLGAVLITEDCWPLTDEVTELLKPALKRHLGYALPFTRHDILRGE